MGEVVAAAGERDAEGAFADRLARLRRPPSPHRQGTTVLLAELDGLYDVLLRLDDDDAGRLDLVDAGVGGVERAGDLVETDFALDLRFEIAPERQDIHQGFVIKAQT